MNGFNNEEADLMTKGPDLTMTGPHSVMRMDLKTEAPELIPKGADLMTIWRI